MTNVTVTQTELANFRPRGLTPTQPPGDNSDKLASTAYVTAAIAAALASVDDYLSGVYFVQPLETVTIPIYRQMINKEGLTIAGTLVVNGQLFLEA